MSAPQGLHVVEHHVARAGVPGAVLVHGSLDGAASFGRVVRRLQDLHVVTYDRRGYRGSRRMRPLGVLEDHVEDLVELVGKGPAVVIGHSYGGDVAIGAALAAPGAVVGLGAWEPPLSWLEWWPRRALISIAAAASPSPAPSRAPRLLCWKSRLRHARVPGRAC